MKSVIGVISGIVIVLGTIQELKVQTKQTVDAAAKCATIMVDDEDPIIVRGHVKNQSGVVISGASVRLVKSGVTVKQTTTNTSGAYIMGGIAADNYQLHLSATGYIPKIINLSVSQETVRTDTLIAE